MKEWWFLLGLASPVLAQPVILQASLEAAVSASVFALRSGVVNAVRGRIGQVVCAGDTLAVLEEGALRLEEEAARLALEQGRRRLGRVRLLHAIGGISAQDLEGLEFAVKAAEIRWRRARLDRQQALITAPMDGILAGIDIEVGERITAGKACFQIIDPTDLKAELFIPVDQLAEVEEGQEVVGWPLADPEQRLRGFVAGISPVVDAESGRCQVLILFPEAGEKCKPGTLVQVELQGGMVQWN